MEKSRDTVSAGISKVNVPVQDRVMLHLFENDNQADRYLVGAELTRPGIAESCALHPPNVSRTMRELLKKNLVSEHTRNIKGDDRRQKTWQLTEEGRQKAIDVRRKLSSDSGGYSRQQWRFVGIRSIRCPIKVRCQHLATTGIGCMHSMREF